MKKFSCILIVFSFLACDRNDAEPGANPEVIAKHQAPFGVSAVDVKLKKVYLNEGIAAEYFYEGDQLIEFKGYSPGGNHQLYLNATITRNGKMPDHYAMKVAEIVWPGGMVFYPPQLVYTMNFMKAIQDSVRYVSITSNRPSGSGAASVVYRFDKSGYLLQSDRGADIPAGYTVVYERDANHNIPESYGTTFSKVEKSPSTKYAYDNQPNPFFKLGIDLEGGFSVKSLSVNNIVREEIQDTDRPYVLNYAYEYLPNGYPSKVTVTSMPESMVLTRVYMFEY
jgi:hypothetical protein